MAPRRLRGDSGVVSDRRRVPGYVTAVVGPVALSVAFVPLRTTVDSAALALVLVLPVVGAAILAGRVGGVIAALVSTASFDVFFTRPYGSFTINAADDLVSTAVLLIVGLVVAQLVCVKERSDRTASARAREICSMRRMAGVGAGGDDPGWLIEASARELADLLAAEVVEYVPGPAPSGLPRLGHGRVVIPCASSSPDARGDRWVALPVDSAGDPLAHFLIRFPDRAAFLSTSPAVRARAVAVADLLGGSLSRSTRPSPN